MTPAERKKFLDNQDSSMRLSLAGDQWLLDGFLPNETRIPLHGRGTVPRPLVPAVRARVPGAIHHDLLAAGLIPDWNIAQNSSACEWVNNREWRYRQKIQIPAHWSGRRIVLCADGLDHSGHVIVNDRLVARFEGSLKRHRFELTELLRPGSTADIAIVFDPSPQMHGYCGYTSQVDHLKPRFSYGWDWSAPLVNIGIWDEIHLEARPTAWLEQLIVTSDLDESLSRGALRVRGCVSGEAKARSVRISVTEADGNTILQRIVAVRDRVDHQWEIPGIAAWWPIDQGQQVLYRLEIELLDDGGEQLQMESRRIGFRRVRWLPADGAPPGALPYVCQVNGRKLFLRGINWVPLSPFYGTVARQKYQQRLSQYAAMHANVLRVWGGGPLEKREFYELCDELGLLVWQEFPLSSSLIDNWPPEKQQTLDELSTVAADYIERRAHHPSLLLWCGGNELQGALDAGKVGEGKPVDLSHPCIARLKQAVDDLDPGRMFLPTSGSGPRATFYADAHGKGLHHDVHGPWEVPDSRAVCDYWNWDDALYRSEVGVPGMAREDAIRTAAAGRGIWWPADETSRFWVHRARSWLPKEPMQREFGAWPDDQPSLLATMVQCSQLYQAMAYRYAVEACRRRAFNCAGVILWMGHDLYPMPSNNSIIEHDGAAKLAYYALIGAMSPEHLSVELPSMIVKPREVLRGRIWLHRDRSASDGASGEWTVSLFDAGGELLDRQSQACAVSSGTIGEFHFEPPQAEQGVLMVRCELRAGPLEVRADHLICHTASSHPLAPLRNLGKTKVDADVSPDRRRIRLHNAGEFAAIGAHPRGIVGWITDDPWPLILLPGESVELRVKPHVGGIVDVPVLSGINLCQPTQAITRPAIELSMLASSSSSPPRINASS